MAQESWKREEEAGCQPPEGPILCTNNCGFFGSVTTMNMCSKCYRELIILKQSKAAAAAAATTGGGIDMASFKKAGLDASIPSTRASPSPSPPSPLSSPSSPSAKAATVFDQVETSTMKIEVCPTQESIDIKVEVEATKVVDVPKVVNGGVTSDVTTVAAGATTGSQDGKRPPPNRCFSCRKRVGLTGFKCRCGDVFCSMHRYSDKHNCSFDYKAAGREAIAKANPIVKADKVEKI